MLHDFQLDDAVKSLRPRRASARGCAVSSMRSQDAASAPSRLGSTPATKCGKNCVPRAQHPPGSKPRQTAGEIRDATARETMFIPVQNVVIATSQPWGRREELTNPNASCRLYCRRARAVIAWGCGNTYWARSGHYGGPIRERALLFSVRENMQNIPMAA
jgi:hypothetical protein